MERNDKQELPQEPSSDDIRAAGQRYVSRARQEGLGSLTIVAGDIVRELRLQYRVPSVVSALRSKRFQKENHITLEHREGPPSGISTTTKFTYRIDDAVQAKGTASSSLLSLRGAGREVYKELGGGEVFLTNERELLNLP